MTATTIIPDTTLTKGRTALIIDSDPISLSTLSFSVSACLDVKPLPAGDHLEALRVLQENHVDVILMYYETHKANPEIARAAKRELDAKRIIILTPCAKSAADVQRLKRSGYTVSVKIDESAEDLRQAVVEALA